MESNQERSGYLTSSLMAPPPPEVAWGTPAMEAKDELEPLRFKWNKWSAMMNFYIFFFNGSIAARRSTYGTRQQNIL